MDRWSEQPFVRPAEPAPRSAVPDWAPWAVLGLLLTVGFAGAFGLVRVPGAKATAAVRTSPDSSPSPVPSVQEGKAVARAPGVPDVITVRQILVQHEKSWKKAPGVTRTKEEARKRCEEARAKLEAGASWDAVMNEYSDNEDTRKNGGVIGEVHWDTASWLIKEPIFKLQLNERSPVSESPFGFHIYQRTK
ncbi:MAG TPA: peptidylprolyl isomerase [Polyangiaceae bacterium]|nr:peptidylprolyl isomerase [Polyangiaceae bacterium]